MSNRKIDSVARAFKTESRAPHSPPPWMIEKLEVMGGREALLKFGDRSLQMPVADAAFIIRTVNSYEELITALKAISDSYASNGNPCRQKEAFVLVRQAIAKVNEEGKWL